MSKRHVGKPQLPRFAYEAFVCRSTWRRNRPPSAGLRRGRPLLGQAFHDTSVVAVIVAAGPNPLPSPRCRLPAPARGDEEPDIVERNDGSLLMDGMMPAYDALNRLGVSMMTDHAGFHTLAGFIIHRLGRIPAAGDHFVWKGWRFEVVDMDGQRIDKVLVSRRPPGGGGASVLAA